MAFLTAALLGLGGYARGRQQRFENEQSQQQAADTHAERMAQLGAEQARLHDERVQNQLDPVTGEFRAYHPPPALSQVVPNNKGKGPAPGSDAYTRLHIGLLYQQANDAEQKGDLVTAQNLRQQARDESLVVGTLASAGLNAAKTAVEPTVGALNDARAYAARMAPQIAVQVAGIRSSAQIQAATIAANSREAVGQMSAGAREYVGGLDATSRQAVAQIAGAYHLKGMEWSAAWSAATRTYDAQERAYTQRSLLNPTAPEPQFVPPASVPNLTVNVGYPPVNPKGVPPTLPPPAKLVAPGVSVPQAGASIPTRTAAPTTNGDPVQQYYGFAQEMLEHGRSLDAVRTGLANAVSQHKLTAAQAAQILAKLRAAAGSGF